MKLVDGALKHLRGFMIKREILSKNLRNLQVGMENYKIPYSIHINDQRINQEI